VAFFFVERMHLASPWRRYLPVARRLTEQNPARIDPTNAERRALLLHRTAQVA